MSIEPLLDTEGESLVRTRRFTRDGEAVTAWSFHVNEAGLVTVPQRALEYLLTALGYKEDA